MYSSSSCKPRIVNCDASHIALLFLQSLISFFLLAFAFFVAVFFRILGCLVPTIVVRCSHFFHWLVPVNFFPFKLTERVLPQVLQVVLVGAVLCEELESWDLPARKFFAHCVCSATTLEVAFAGFPFLPVLVLDKPPKADEQWLQWAGASLLLLLRTVTRVYRA